jgi:glycosyltransferase involved in cell wall biosynthesis
MNSDMPLLSVIVPIYLVEEYLPQCVESLLDQTYHKMEVLLINDGSLNQYRVNYDELIKKDCRIKVFHKENGGFSDALNYGIGHASGEYIAFVDGDDYISNNKAFEIMIEEALKTKADIVVGNYHKDIAGALVPAKEHGFNSGMDQSTEDFRFYSFFSVGHLSYMWGKIYKRDFITSHDLVLKPYIYAQDKLFNVECYLYNPKYSYINDYVYSYRQNLSSISHRYKINYAQIWIEISEEMYKDIKEIKDNSQYMDLVAYNFLFAVFFSSKQEYMNSGGQRKVLKEELKKYSNNKLMMKFVKEIIRGKYLKFRGGLHWKLFLWGLSFGLSLKLYWITSIALKVLIDLKVDNYLSSVGGSSKSNSLD